MNESKEYVGRVLKETERFLRWTVFEFYPEEYKILKDKYEDLLLQYNAMK